MSEYEKHEWNYTSDRRSYYCIKCGINEFQALKKNTN